MVTEWAAAHGLWVAEVVTEVGSGMKGSGRELGRLPSDATATTVVVANRTPWPD